jgi:hypothetical protein
MSLAGAGAALRLIGRYTAQANNVMSVTAAK